MASIKISDLPSVSTITDDDVLPIVNSDDTKKVLISQLKELFGGDSSGDGIKDISDAESINPSTYPSGVYYSRREGTLRIYVQGTSGTCVDVFTTTGAYIFVFNSGYLSWLTYIIAIDRDYLYYVDSNGLQAKKVSLVSLMDKVLFTNNTTAYTPTGDYNPATKKYVDDLVGSASGGSDDKVYVLEDISNYNTNDNKTVIANIAKDIDDGKHPIVYVHSKYKNESYSTSPKYLYMANVQREGTYIALFVNIGKGGTYSSKMGVQYQIIEELQLTSSYNSSTGAVGNITVQTKNSFIPTLQWDDVSPVGYNNSTAFTPTGDYNLANKKYVDDSISNKIWIGTQTEYDALSSHSSSTVYFIKES